MNSIFNGIDEIVGFFVKWSQFICYTLTKLSVYLAGVAQRASLSFSVAKWASRSFSVAKRANLSFSVTKWAAHFLLFREKFCGTLLERMRACFLVGVRQRYCTHSEPGGRFYTRRRRAQLRCRVMLRTRGTQLNSLRNIFEFRANLSGWSAE